MDFCEATDALFVSIGHAELANQLGVSVQAIRQARSNAASASYRDPPKRWQEAVIRLAEVQALHYRKLIDELRDGL